MNLDKKDKKIMLWNSYIITAALWAQFLFWDRTCHSRFLESSGLLFCSVKGGSPAFPQILCAPNSLPTRLLLFKLVGIDCCNQRTLADVFGTRSVLPLTFYNAIPCHQLSSAHGIMESPIQLIATTDLLQFSKNISSTSPQAETELKCQVSSIHCPQSEL